MTTIIDTKKVAERVNRSVPTIQRWCRTGRIPHKRIGKKTILFTEAEITAWLAGKTEGEK